MRHMHSQDSTTLRLLLDEIYKTVLIYSATEKTFFCVGIRCVHIIENVCAYIVHLVITCVM